MKKRPQVLLLGNGICRLNKGDSWVQMLNRIKSASKSNLNAEKLTLPMPLRAMLMTDNKLGEAIKAHSAEKMFYGGKLNKLQNEIISQLLIIGFDEILTTNYSYELEACALKHEPEDSLLIKHMQFNKAEAVKRAEPKYMLHTYYAIPTEDHENHIWHIHGEARKPSSMIIGHDYYATLLTRMKGIADATGNYSKHFADDTENIKSWVDSFIYGDVFILGLGMDFSEFDLWWLIDRKHKELGLDGKVYWLQPSYPLSEGAIDEKRELLKCMGVIPEDLAVSFNGNESKTEEVEKHIDFYIAAIGFIKDKVSNSL